MVKGISFVGQLRSGKTTMADSIMYNTTGFPVRLSFATALKQEVAFAMAKDVDEYESFLLEMADPDKKHHWRLILQWWGTDYRRRVFGQDYWVDKIAPIVKRESGNPNSTLVFDDCRFINEYELLKANDVMFVKCLPSPYATGQNTDHISEEHWNSFECELELPWVPVEDRKRIFLEYYWNKLNRLAKVS